MRRTIERARAYQQQGLTLRAVGLMQNLIDAQPSDENLTFLAELYTQQGLFHDAAALYLRVVKAELGRSS